MNRINKKWKLWIWLGVGGLLIVNMYVLISIDCYNKLNRRKTYELPIDQRRFCSGQAYGVVKPMTCSTNLQWISIIKRYKLLCTTTNSTNQTINKNIQPKIISKSLSNKYLKFDFLIFLNSTLKNQQTKITNNIV